MANDIYYKNALLIKSFHMHFYWIGQRFLQQKCLNNDFCFKDEVGYYLPTPPLGQDMTQGQFLSGV